MLCSTWRWPSPVQLCVPHQLEDLGMSVWDSTDYRDRHDLMPLLTPAYPSMNSAFNVNQGTLETMKVLYSGSAGTPPYRPGPPVQSRPTRISWHSIAPNQLAPCVAPELGARTRVPSCFLCGCLCKRLPQTS